MSVTLFTVKIMLDVIYKIYMKLGDHHESVNINVT